MKDKLTAIEFTPKRSNQIFQSPENRIKYHNLKSKEKREKLKTFDAPLKNNFKILENLLLKENYIVYSKEFLLGAGLNFSFFTHYTNINGANHPSIYNYTLVLIDNINIKIIKNG